MSIDARCGRINAVYFEGKVWQNKKEFLSGKIWVAQEGKFGGQVVKCSFKIFFWPLVVKVVIEIM